MTAAAPARDLQPSPDPLVVRNDIALAGWVFMAIWMGMLCLFTWLYLRDGGMPGTHPFLALCVMSMFWLFGLGGSGHFFGQPRVYLNIRNGEGVLLERWICRRQEERFHLSQLPVPDIVSDKDSEGDPYFRCTLMLPSGRRVTVKESNDRAVVEATRDAIVAASA